MGIYIKDLEMPKEPVALIICPDGKVFRVSRQQQIAEAVPVPQHGRLKDYDKITDQYSKWARSAKYREYAGMYNMLQTALDDAPTIIPADENY